VAVTHPERVARLVLSGSPAGSLPQQVAVGLQATVRALADPVPRPTSSASSRPAWRDAADGLVAFDDTADLERITAPTLLVWGDRDGLLPPEEQQHLTAAIPGARSQLYQETGHSPHWERPERFAADLDAFMREG
jgi:non-heme chloroperoxidase